MGSPSLFVFHHDLGSGLRERGDFKNVETVTCKFDQVL